MTQLSNFLIKLLISLITIFGLNTNAGQDPNGWSQSNGGTGSNKFLNSNQINKQTIPKLTKAWQFNSNERDITDTVQTTPIYVANLIITATVDGTINALEPSTGKLVWTRKLPWHTARRGLASSENRIYIPTPSETHEIDPKNGLTLQIFAAGSKVPPILNADKIYIAETGSVSAFSILTGKKIWSRSLEKNGAHPRIWSGFSHDSKNNILFVVTSNNTLYENLNTGHANSLVAISEKDGEILWSYKELARDWRDLDMVGPPIVSSGKIKGKDNDFVIALSKTGAVRIFNSLNGSLLNSNTTSVRETDNQENLNNIYFAQDTNFKTSDIITDGSDKEKYLRYKTRNISDDISHLPRNSQHAFYGIHGGAEWFGGSYKPDSSILVVPMNRYPWFIRSEATNNSNIKINSLTDFKLRGYQKSCAVCHGTDLEGVAGGEMVLGDNVYFPSLIGLSKRVPNKDFSDVAMFRKNHEFAIEEYAASRFGIRGINTTGGFYDTFRQIAVLFKYALRKYFYRLAYSAPSIIEIESADLDEVYKEISLIDSMISSNGGISERRFFQPILDLQGYPGTNPPWGELVAYDLAESKMIWRVPFGHENNPDGTRRAAGSRNFGGVLMTGGNLVFANGTTDEYARAYDATDGSLRWEAKLPFAGSAPPMSFVHQGCQYLIFTATGGRFKGFSGSGDATVAYRLADCRP